MARRALPDFSDDEIIDAETEDRSQIRDDIQEETDKIRAAIDSDPDEVNWRITISRDGEGNSVGPWLFDCSATEFEKVRERLLEDYGTGRYQARVYRNNRLFTRKIIAIEAPKNSVPATGLSQISEVANAIKTSQDQMAQLIAGKIPQNGNSDPMQIAAAMFGSMVQMIGQMRETFTPMQPKSRFEDIKEMAGIMTLLREFSSDGGGKGDTNLYDLIAKLVDSPVVEGLAENLKNARPPQIGAPARPALLAHNPPAQNQAQNRAQNQAQNHPSQKPETPLKEETALLLQSIDDALRAQLVAMLEFWNGRAIAGNDPGLYAEVAIDTIGVDVIGSLILRDDLRDIAAVLYPPALTHWPWFEELKGEISSLLTDDADGADKPEDDQLARARGNDTKDAFAPDAAPAPAANAKGDSRGKSGNESDVENNGRSRAKRKTAPAHPAKGD